MKLSVLSGLIVACAAAVAAAQTTTPRTTAGTQTSRTSPNQTISMTGCVGAGASATDPMMLSNVTVGGPVATTPGMPATGAAAAAPPPTTAGTTGAATGAPPPPPVPPTTGTATAGTTGTATAGAAGTAGAVGSVGTAGTTGTAATAPGAAASGYRLSGADMQPFVGQRVQLTGTMTPAAPGASGAATTPGFRVMTVRPLAGGCQPQQ